jgi:hypothetical protein
VGQHNFQSGPAGTSNYQLRNSTMKKLLLAACLLASICQIFAQTKIKGVLLDDQVTVTFSATPTFDASKANLFKITLTGNVTSSTLSNALVGQQLGFEICQDATGGRTFVPPTNVSGFATIPAGANVCSLQFYWFDGTNALPNLIAAITVSAVNGVSFPATPALHSVLIITASNTGTYKVVPDCQDSTGNHINYTQSTDTWSCGTSVPANTVTTTATQSLSGKSLVSPIFNTGVSQGSGLKHQRFGTTCATAAAANSVCTTVFTWTSAFADASYTAVCQGDVNTVNTAFLIQSGHTASTVSVVTINGPGGGAVTFTNVNCIAIHD